MRHHLLPSATTLAFLSEAIYLKPNESAMSWPGRFERAAAERCVQLIDHVDEHDIQAALCTWQDTAILVFRGTDSAAENITNLFARLSPDPVVTGTSVHVEWGADTTRVLNLLESSLSSVQATSWLTTGHSRGAAMAQIAAARLAVMHPRPTYCMTLESPRPGNAAFAEFMRLNIPHLRWIQSGSIVPVVPLPPRFLHDVNPFAFDGHGDLRVKPGLITQLLNHLQAIAFHIGVPGLASVRLHSCHDLRKKISKAESVFGRPLTSHYLQSQ